jgi:hypothetical protein
LHGDYPFVRLVYAKQYNPAEHYHSARADCHFMPRLHAIPLRLTTLSVQTSAADFASSYQKNEQTRGGNRCQSDCLYPYIRPSGSKCFARGLLHFGGSGFKAGDLLEPVAPLGQPHPPWRCSQPLKPFYVQNTRKERVPIPPGNSPNSRPGLPVACHPDTTSEAEWHLSPRHAADEGFKVPFLRHERPTRLILKAKA